MQVKQIIADVGVGLIGGYVGTKVMEPVSMKLYELEPEADRQQEDRVRPGPPYDIAARKTAALLGLQLTDKQVEQAGLVFHYGLGMSWGTVYTPAPPTDPAPASGGRAPDGCVPIPADRRRSDTPARLQRAEPRLPALDASTRIRRASGVWPERSGRG